MTMTDAKAAQATQRAQMLFNKGFSAFERANLDVAIDLLSDCLKQKPDFLRARKFLRAAQVQRFRKSGGNSPLPRLLATLRGIPLFLKTSALLKSGKIEPAMIAAEKMLSLNPLNRKFGHVFAQVAERAGLVDAAALTLETLREHHPNDAELVRHMGKVYDAMERYHDAKVCYEKLLELAPHDGEALKLLKDAMARESMGAGWEKAAGEEGASARDLVRDGEQTRMLDLKSKAVKSEDDLDQLAEETRAKIEAEPRNLNYRRSLARLLSQGKRFDEALQAIDEAREINPNDPEMDRLYAQTKLQKFDRDIQALRAEDRHEEAEKLESEREQFAFDDLVERVERYPNDLHLRYELGMKYFDYQHYEDAIQQFQIAQRSPKDRVEALFYLGLCFKAKGQYDMAQMQLEEALKLLPTMNDQRKEVLYALGELAESTNDPEGAAERFKEIYREDIGFKDVAAKVEKVYADGNRPGA